MGRLQRLAQQRRMEAGIIPVRIGPKEHARDRKAREKKAMIELPGQKGAKPLKAEEQEAVFAQARKIKNEVAAGLRPDVPVNLGEDLFDPMEPDVLDVMKDVASRILNTRLPRGIGRAASSPGDDEPA